jgi:hypothetical protein
MLHARTVSAVALAEKAHKELNALPDQQLPITRFRLDLARRQVTAPAKACMRRINLFGV